MPLPPRVNLADLTAEDLVQEMLGRVRAHTPDWQPQPGDPGRTVIELFAWLAETLLYRVNLVPERQRLEFLRLLNLGLRPARPATGLVQLAPANAARPAAVTVRPGSSVQGPVPFETTGDITVQPVEGRVYLKRRPEPGELEGLDDLIAGLETLFGIPGSEPYITTPCFADGQAVPAGIDLLGTSVDGSVWIALLATDGEPASREAAQAALRNPPVLLNVGVVPRLAPTDPEADAPPVDLPDVWRWQITTGRLLPNRDAELVTLEVDQDGTAGLATEGTLRLLLPDESQIGEPGNAIERDERAGVGLRPPRIDEPETAARLIAWLRLSPARGEGGGGAALPLSWLGVNAVTVDQRRTVRNTVVATMGGTAGEEARLPGRSIDPETLELQLTGPDGAFERWRRVADLAACGPDDRCFELDGEAGTVRFGDGVRGRLPEPGARLRVAFMRHGGGRAGNLPPGSLTGVTLVDRPDPPPRASQPAPTTGGEDAETLEEAERRLPARLRHRERAVTAQDYRDLAALTPAVRLGRVEVLPRFRPFQRRPDVPGVVSVMVLPEADVPKPPNPRPDRNTIERVRAYLDARRPLTTELYVIGCEYRPLALSLALSVREGFARDRVVRDVREALAVYLWPLPPGGRDGEGWPLAQPVVNRELEVVVARVPGVRATMGVNLFQPTTGAGWRKISPDPATGAQVLTPEPWQLPELLSVRVALDVAAPPETIEEPPPAAEAPKVAVPIVPEVC